MSEAIAEDQGAGIWRDAYGVLHVRAKTPSGAFEALGYAHATDRLWQMEATVRRATGQYAEWAGPSALAGDIAARKMGTAAASRRDYNAVNDETRAMLQSYACGVNRFIEKNPPPPEYETLGATPTRWEPWHSIAVMRQTGFLMGSVWWKLWRAAALPYIGLDQIAKLRFDDGGRDQLCIPSDAVDERYYDDLSDILPEALDLMRASATEVAGGSNNWAVAPGRTRDGRPILAGDPHRVLDIPGMYLQNHVACNDFDVIGLTVPGVPGFPHFAHNGNVAWCVTHAFMDLHDLYIEKFSDDGALYLFRGEWLPASQRVETIEVRGAAAHELTVTETQHGPIFVGDPATGTALALKSIQFCELDHSFNCMLPLMRSRTVEELFAAGEQWGLVDHNLVAADTAGTIGHQVRAKVPKRKSSAGWLPVPGWTGDNEWDGCIAFEEMPTQINPALGLIATANNRVVPTGGPNYFTTDCMPPHRARAIMEHLSTLNEATPEKMTAIFGGLRSYPAEELRDRIAMLELGDGPAAAVQRLLADWDCRIDAASTVATAYAELRLSITRIVLRQSNLEGATDSALMEPARPGLSALSALWWTVPQLLRADDVGLLGGASWDDVLTEAMVEIGAKAPFEPWGAVHRPYFRHPLNAMASNDDQWKTFAGAELSGDCDTVFTNGYSVDFGFTTVYGSIARYVFDIGNWDNCSWISFHGTAGYPKSEFYFNQNKDWSENRQVPMLYNWRKIEQSSVWHTVI